MRTCKKTWTLLMGFALAACQDKVGALREDDVASLDPKAPLALGELVLSPDSRELFVGERFPISALLFLPYQRTEDVSRDVVWETSAPESLALETSSDGAYVKALGEGKAILSARYGGKLATSQLHVNPNSVANAFLGVAQKTLVLSRLQSSFIPLELSAHLIGMMQDGSTKNLNAEGQWSSSDEQRLKLLRPGQFQALAPGQVTVSVVWEGKTYQQAVVIDAVEKTIEGLELASSARILALQTPENFQIEAVFNDGTRTAVTALATLASAQPQILRIESSPNFRLLGLQEGSTTLTAQFQGKSLQVPIRVVDPLYQSLRLEATSSPAIPLGGSEFWKAYLVLSDGSEEDVSTRVVWTSSVPTLAEFSALETEKGRIFGRRLGTATVQANFLGLLQSAAVSVEAARPLTLEISGVGTGPLGLYLSRDFRAYGDFTDGIRREITRSVSWTVESLGGNAYFDPSAAARLVASATGNVRVVARILNLQSVSSVAIGSVSPVYMEILGAQTAISLSGPSPRVLTTRVTMSDGQLLDKTLTTEWTYTVIGEGLSFAAYVENSGQRKGLCTPLQVGKISVKASYEALQATALVEVQP